MSSLPSDPFFCTNIFLWAEAQFSPGSSSQSWTLVVPVSQTKIIILPIHVAL